MLSRLLKSFGMRNVKAVVDAYPYDGDIAKNQTIFSFDLAEKQQLEQRLGLLQIPVALDETNGGELFWMCALAHMAIYAIEMTKLEVNVTLVTTQTCSSQFFSEHDLNMTYDVEQSSLNALSFRVFHYYLEGHVNVAHYTTANALFNAEIKRLQLHCIFFEDVLFKPMKVKGDGSCVYKAVASHIMSFCLDDS